MSTHRVVAAGAERCFHPRARIARIGAFEQDFADPEATPLERDHRQSGDHDIAPQDRTGDLAMAGERGDHWQVFELDEGYSALAAAAEVAVADQALARDRDGFTDL